MAGVRVGQEATPALARSEAGWEDVVGGTTRACPHGASRSLTTEFASGGAIRTATEFRHRFEWTLGGIAVYGSVLEWRTRKNKEANSYIFDIFI